ncbi:MAG: type II toxin-antitoxin system HicA family toxin [Paracoccaceae bacterium]
MYINVFKKDAMELETNSRKLLKVLKDEGFEEVHKRGLHLKLRKGNRTVILPHPKKDLPIGTVREIYESAGLL